jgi:hypothetical protein
MCSVCYRERAASAFHWNAPPLSLHNSRSNKFPITHIGHNFIPPAALGKINARQSALRIYDSNYFLDGRAISALVFIEMLMEIFNDCFLAPSAHWTPKERDAAGELVRNTDLVGLWFFHSSSRRIGNYSTRNHKTLQTHRWSTKLNHVFYNEIVRRVRMVNEILYSSSCGTGNKLLFEYKKILLFVLVETSSESNISKWAWVNSVVL